MADSDYALVVGINRYPRISDLEGPARDAEMFTKWLVAKKDPVPPGNIKKFLSPDEAGGWIRSPNYYEIEQWLEGLVNRGLEGEEFGRLYLFLAGHGFESDILPLYVALLMANGDYYEYSTHHIPGYHHADSLYKSGYFKEIILFMDTCRDLLQGAVFRRLLNFRPRPASQSTTFFYGLATKWGAKSRETPVVDEGNSVRGRFSRFILDGLQGGADQGTGRITGEMLEVYVKNRFTDLRNQSPQEQRALIEDPEFGPSANRSIVLVGPPEVSIAAPVGVDLKVTIKTPLDSDPKYLYLLGTGREYLSQYSANPADSPFIIHGMNTGMYSLIIPDTNWVKVFKVVGSGVSEVPADQMASSFQSLPIDIEIA